MSKLAKKIEAKRQRRVKRFVKKAARQIMKSLRKFPV